MKKLDAQVFVMPGNDDEYFVDEELAKSEYIINPNEKATAIMDQFEMLSLGYANITPWKCARDIEEEELYKKIENLVNKISNFETAIFNVHVPPYGTSLDEAPELDENLKPKLGPSGRVMTKSVGSTSVRTAIEKYQPLLSLHGHVHESKGFIKIGRTLCLNLGSEYTEGILRGVLIQFDKNKIKDFLFTSG